MALRFSLKEFGCGFATRGRGEEVRVALLARLGDRDAAVIDFADVENVTYSFADEFAGKLAAPGTINVVYENMAPNVARAVERAVARRTAVAINC